MAHAQGEETTKVAAADSDKGGDARKEGNPLRSVWCQAAQAVSRRTIHGGALFPGACPHPIRSVSMWQKLETGLHTPAPNF
jgi:hypothetical protein